MKNAFEMLSRFLEQYGEEVEGRGLEDMPPEVKTKLREFANSKLGAADRGELARLLKENPSWISALAEEVKGRREAGKK